jgi:predicted DNA-binding transcriptional regulator AlpA
MGWDPSARASASPVLVREPELSFQSRRSQNGGAEMKARQSAKIRELADAARVAGYLTLDQQAKVFGLARSTAWTITNASHKASGLSASTINRMLAAPELPQLVRTKILEYVEEKAAGLYGGSRSQRRRFTARLNGNARPLYEES